MAIDEKCLTETFVEGAYADERFRQAAGVVWQNSRGRIWIIGGYLYKNLIRAMHGNAVPAKDYDFVVEFPRKNIHLPDGWRMKENRFGNFKFWNGKCEIDFIALEKILSITQRNLPPTIENYIGGVNFNVFALAYDLHDERIIDGGGLEALSSKVVRVHNPEMAGIAAGIYGTNVNDMMMLKAEEIGFAFEEV